MRAIDAKLIGKRVVLRFWDHCKDHNQPVLCVISGTVTEVTRLHTTIATWETYNEKGEIDPHNTDYYSILVSAVTECQVIKDLRWTMTSSF